MTRRTNKYDREDFPLFKNGIVSSAQMIACQKIPVVVKKKKNTIIYFCSRKKMHMMSTCKIECYDLGNHYSQVPCFLG